MPGPAVERDSYFQRAVDWIFGYDFFISYSHGDGLNYPRQLKQRLQHAGFKAFLDQTEYVPGLDLRRETSRQVRKSRKIVIIGRPAALRSEWVKREVDVAISRRMTPVIININNAVETAGPDAAVATLARERHWLRLNETIAAIDGDPSERAVEELVRGFRHTRQETKRLRVFAGATALFAVLALGAGLAAVEAFRQKSVAERNFAAAKQAADGLVFDIARGLRDVAGLRADSVRRILGRSEAALNRLLETDPNNPALQRSRAAMLGEFSVTYLTVGDIDRATAAARQAVGLSEHLVARTPADASARRDLALNLVRMADAATEKGDLGEAGAIHERALAIRRAVATGDPNDLDAARDVTTSLMRLGEIAETAGDFPRAARLFGEALELRKPLAKARPAWRRDLTVGYLKLGDVRLTQRDLAGAGAAFEAGIANARELAQEDRTSSRWLRDLAVALQRQGNLGVRTKDAALATKAYGECLTIFQGLARSDPDNLEWSNDIAISRFKLGQAAIVGRDHGAAMRHLKEALDERRALLKKSPENHQVLTDVAENLIELAKIAEVADRPALLREARSVLLSLKARGRTGRTQDAWLESIEASVVGSAR
jgi:tetratricopeptide (TPR) repeat protein